MVTDTHGRRVDFRNTVIVMTSNVGARRITAKGKRLGFSPETGGALRPAEEVKRAVLDDLKGVFRPEFLNRLDEIIVFRQLDRRELRDIAARLVEQVGRRLDRLGVSLRVEEGALDLLAELGFDPDYGARPLRRAIRAKVEDPAAEALLNGGLTAGDGAALVLREGALRLLPEGKRDAAPSSAG